MQAFLLERGEMDQSVIWEWLVIDPDFKCLDIGFIMSFLTYKQHNGLGWRYVFAMLTNPVSLKLAHKFNGDVIAEITLT